MISSNHMVHKLGDCHIVARYISWMLHFTGADEKSLPRPEDCFLDPVGLCENAGLLQKDSNYLCFSTEHPITCSIAHFYLTIFVKE